MKTWARAFLQEGADMGDQSWFFISMMKQARIATEQAAKDAAIGALSEAAKQERDRRALAKQFYERQALWDSGICPDCLYEVVACECEDAADER